MFSVKMVWPCIVMSCIVITSCNRNPVSGDRHSSSGEITVAKSSLAQEKPVVDPADRESLVTGNIRFAVDFYRQLAVEDGNVFFSPYSISSALAMTYGGAKGATKQEMREVLHFTLDSALLHKNFNALEDDILSDSDIKLSIVNQTWGEYRTVFKQEYLDLLAVNYGTGINLVDFAGDPDGCRELINSWIADQTSDKIPDLLPEESIDAATTLALTNAIYFYGNWQTQFDKGLTVDKPFYRSPDDTVNAAMMSFSDNPDETMQFRYTKNDYCSALELPYTGNRFAMTVILPADSNLSGFEQQLSVDRISQITEQLETEDVHVTLPAFSFTSASLPLKRKFMNLGMNNPFTGEADFTGICESPRIFIDDIHHKAFINVNEEGTESAAASGVVMVWESAQQVERFVANRPFFFMIRDRETGTILFMGRVVDPTQS